MSRQRPFWRRRLLPAFALLLALNLAALAAWTVPQGYKQRNAAAQLEAARGELQAASRATARLRERASAIRSNLADRGRFYAKEAGSMDSELVPTLEAIEKMARLPGLKPGARGISRREVPATSLEEVKVSLGLEGSYSQLVGFLREVESSPRFLTVDSISMRSGAEGAALQVQLSAFMNRRLAAEPKRGRRARS